MVVSLRPWWAEGTKWQGYPPPAPGYTRHIVLVPGPERVSTHLVLKSSSSPGQARLCLLLQHS